MCVSIVIPCYQQEEYLTRALESIDAQDYQDIEVIVVDDGSVKPVEIIKEKYAFPIKLIRQTNQGLSAARNTGIANSSGSLIKFLDADDKLLPGCIRMQAVSLERETSAVNIIGFVEIDEETNAEAEIIPAFGDPLSALMMDNLAPIHSYMFVKSAVENIGRFSTDERIVYGCEDYDLIFRLAISGCKFYSSHQLGVVYYRRHGTMSKNSSGMQKSRVDVWIHNVLFFLKNKPDISCFYIIPLLTGLAKINKWLSDDQYILARDIISIANNALVKRLFNIPKSELFSLLKLVSSLELFSPLCESLNNIVHGHHNSKINITSTEINSYKLFLNGMQNSIEDDWVIKVLTYAKKHSGQIGIYGAGEYGVRLQKICTAAGYEVKCYFDKSLFSVVNDNGIPIYHPDEIKEHNISLIIIASVAFYDEILDSIEHLPCVVI